MTLPPSNLAVNRIAVWTHNDSDGQLSVVTLIDRIRILKRATTIPNMLPRTQAIYSCFQIAGIPVIVQKKGFLVKKNLFFVFGCSFLEDRGEIEVEVEVKIVQIEVEVVNLNL